MNTRVLSVVISRAVLLAMALTMLGCGDEGGAIGDPAPAVAGRCGDLSSTAMLRDTATQPTMTFPRGQKLSMEVAVTNNGSANAVLTAGDPCTGVSFEVTNEAGQRVWGNRDGMSCEQLVTDYRFTPGQTIIWKAEWTQQTTSGGSVSRGNYVARAIDKTFQCGGALTASTGFTIQ